MVGFIINEGQLDNIEFDNLHSTMVGFIIEYKLFLGSCAPTFTFHYGWIYYFLSLLMNNSHFHIYIPLWLDLLLRSKPLLALSLMYLHSTMVGFIIINK